MIERAFLDFLAARVPSIDFGLGVESVEYFFQNAPQDQQPPFAVFHLTGESEDYPKGSQGLVYQDFDLEVFCSRSDSAAILSSAIKSEINGFSGDMGGNDVTLMRVQNGFDSQESETDLFYRNLNVQINYMRQ